MNLNSKMFVAAGLLTLSLTGCVDRQAQKEAKATQQFVSNPLKTVSVQTVKEQTLVQTQELTGSVTSGEDTQIGPKTTGRLVAVYVKDGDPVSAGQVIAEQDISTLRDQLNMALAGLSSANAQLSQAKANALVGPSKSSASVAAAQAQLRSAQAGLQKAKAGARPEERQQAEWQVRSAKSALDTARAQLDRQQQLFNQGASARQQLDQAQTAYDAALTAYNAALQSQLAQASRPEDVMVAEEAVRSAQENLRSAQGQKRLDVLLDDQVRAAMAGVQSAQAQVAIARQAVEDAKIRAPFAGHISGKPMQAGGIASPGSTIARLVGGQGAYFEGQVSEDMVSSMAVNSPVTIKVDALPARTFEGHIAGVNPMGTDVGRLFTVRVMFHGSTDGIKPGMYARGTVTIRTIPNSIVVPVSSIVKNGAQNTVYVVEGDKAKAVNVKPGVRQQDMIQVDGLQAGQQLVIQGQDTLTDGAKVSVDKSGQASASLAVRAVGG